MKHQKQIDTNREVEKHYFSAIDEMKESNIEFTPMTDVAFASVAETKSYYILASYDIIVAVINKQTKICYDMRKAINSWEESYAHIVMFVEKYGSKFEKVWM